MRVRPKLVNEEVKGRGYGFANSVRENHFMSMSLISKRKGKNRAEKRELSVVILF